MADLSGFDANQVDPTSDFELLPAGKYLAVITESAMLPNKAGTGSYLELKFTIIDGPHKGRVLWKRLNIDHPNATAVQIAKSELAAICRAVGILSPKDSVELHNVPVLITVKLKKRSDTGEFTNEIKGYAKKETPAASASGAQQVNTTLPWRRS